MLDASKVRSLLNTVDLDTTRGEVSGLKVVKDREPSRKNEQGAPNVPLAPSEASRGGISSLAELSLELDLNDAHFSLILDAVSELSRRKLDTKLISLVRL